jgi:hypothetical protein
VVSSVAVLPLRSLEGESRAHTLSDWADFSNGIGISCMVTQHLLDTLCLPRTGLSFIFRVHYETSLEMTVVAYPTSWLSSAAQGIPHHLTEFSVSIGNDAVLFDFVRQALLRYDNCAVVHHIKEGYIMYF